MREDLSKHGCGNDSPNKDNPVKVDEHLHEDISKAFEEHHLSEVNRGVSLNSIEYVNEVVDVGAGCEQINDGEESKEKQWKYHVHECDHVEPDVEVLAKLRAVYQVQELNWVAQWVFEVAQVLEVVIFFCHD